MMLMSEKRGIMSTGILTGRVTTYKTTKLTDDRPIEEPEIRYYSKMEYDGTIYEINKHTDKLNGNVGMIYVDNKNDTEYVHVVVNRVVTKKNTRSDAIYETHTVIMHIDTKFLKENVSSLTRLVSVDQYGYIARGLL